MASPSPPSSPSPSPPAKPSPSSQPLHNFELPPLLKWNSSSSKDGKSGGSHRRHHRSMKSPPPNHSPIPLISSPLRRTPPPPRNSPLRDFAAARIQTHPPRAAEGKEPPAALDDEFEKLAQLREETLNRYRRRDWWSETGKSDDVIAYRRNPLKKSGFSPPIGRFSNSEFRMSDSAGDFDVYRRRSSFASPPARFGFSSGSDGKRSDGAAGEIYDVYRRNPYKKSAFAASLSPRPSFFNSEEGKKPKAEFDSYNRFPFKKPFFSSNFEERKSHKSAAERNVYHRNPLKKYEFAASSSKKSEERKFKLVAETAADADADADTYPKNSFFKKSAFGSASSPKKLNFAPNSEDKGKKEKKKSVVAEAADASNPKNNLKKPAFASLINLEKKSKVSEGGDHTHASPKKKSPIPSPAKKLLHASSSSSISEDSKKFNSAEADANPKKQSEFAPSPSKKKPKAPESDAAAAEIKIEEKPNQEMKNDDEEADEEIKVWNLRPRNVKSKPSKAVAAVAGGSNSKNKGQQQVKSGGGDGEKKEGKEKEKKLSIAISLTKEEIEEDIFALTGAKPARRPKKRPRNVQKQLDNVFPGLWLLSITSESYKVSENSLK